MNNPKRKIAFVLTSTDHGTLILNRFDYHAVSPGQSYGVGIELLEHSSFEAPEIESISALLDLRRKFYGDGVCAIDCGANIGTHTVEWAKRMTGWGSVIAIEAQERIYYALAGNLAINNCFNAKAVNAAVADEDGVLTIPVPNYQAPASFGSLELQQRPQNEFIGQPIEYAGVSTAAVRKLALDSLKLARVDIIKIDVEGMELEVLRGARKTIEKLRPILLIEAIKVDQAQLRSTLESLGYKAFRMGRNFLAVHEQDECLAHVGSST